MKKILFLPLFILLITNNSYSQSNTLNGRIFDAETNEALVGVNVLIKGSKSGVSTNINGSFSLNASLNNTLLISYLGYETKEVKASLKQMDIKLTSSSSALNDVLVVAYGTTNKASYTGSASTINQKDLDKQQSSSVSRSLQGLVPGLQSVASAGQPGSNAEIRLRGVGSINASSNPLYVVDGAPYSGDINSINAADIASITVLKDASASALYGSRGANGVIIITTKQGSLDSAPEVSINANSGISSRATNDYGTLNTQQYFELQWEALRNTQVDQGKSPDQAAKYASEEVVNTLKVNPFGSGYPKPIGLDGKLVPGATALWNDNWTESMTRNGIRNQLDIGINGGGNASKYYVSAGYLKDQGFIIGSEFTRFNARINYNSKIKEWLDASFHVAASSTDQDAPPQSDSNSGNYANIGRLISNLYPLYERNDDGTYKLDEHGNQIYDFGNYRPSSASAGNNLLGQAALNKFNSKKELISFRGTTEINLVKGLKLKSSINADYTNSLNHTYINPEFGTGISSKGSVDKGAFRDLGYTYNNLLDYSIHFNEKHTLNILGGQEVYILNTSTLAGSRSNFGFSGKEEPAAASLITAFSGISDNYKLASFLGKIDYDYNKKYFFSASFRRDGSSRFSPESRWGNFWSVGASWNIKHEPFLSQVHWINNLSLRSSYGAQGNDNLGSYYAYQDLYSIYNSLGEAGLITSRLPTPGLKWETNLNFNTGIDFTVLNNRLSGTFEVYQRSSKDLLFSRPLAPSLGFTAIDDNIGSLKNTGFEGQLNGIIVNTPDFKWNIGLNFGHYKNKITALPQEEIISGDVGQLGSTKKLMVGSSVYDFYIREWAGVDPENGNPLWYKNTQSSSNPDQSERTTTSIYADADQYFQGSSLPDVYGGLSNTITFKDFELSALISYSIGGKILDLDKVMLSHNGENFGRTWSSEMINRWTPEHTATDVPRLATVASNWNSVSTRFLYSASYARLRNVNLAYALPKQLSNRLKTKTIRVYTRAENLFTLFGPEGLDPEQAMDGVTFYRYPTQKTFTFGLEVTF